MERSARIFVAGHRGLVGSALVRTLQKEGYTNLLLKTRTELDLCDHAAVEAFFEKEKPEYVFLAAAKVGGIVANQKAPGSFLYENLQIQNAVIESARQHGVTKLLFLGSSCIYPRLAPQPIKEEYLLTGPLEPTNEGYALAKIAGLKLCDGYNREFGTRYIALMPTNLYGPGDNFDLEHSHFLAACIRRMHEAKIGSRPSVTMWGTGMPKREFMHVDDLAAACLFCMEKYDGSEFLNVGTGEDETIKDLAALVREIVGYIGEIIWDTTKPDGMPRKLLDVSKLHTLGWHHAIDLAEGIRTTYEWFLAKGPVSIL